MRKNADLSSIKAVNPIFSVFSCQFVVTEYVHYIVQGKNKVRSNQERFLVVASPGIFLFKSYNFLPGINLEKIFPFVSISKLEVSPNYIIVTKTKTNNSDDCQLVFKSVNQVIIAAKIHSIREALFGDTGLPYEITIDPSLIDDFNRQKYVYSSTSKIMDIFLSNVLIYEFPKVQLSKFDIICPLLNQIQEYQTLEINSELMTKPYLSSLAATLSIDNDIKEIRLCDINLGTGQFQKFFISVLQRTKSIRRLIFLNVSFDNSDFSQFVYFMNSNSTFCGDEWIFDKCDFTKIGQSNFDQFFNSFEKYQRPVRILTFNRCKFALTIFEKVSRDILFFNCFHSLEVLWITSVEYPDFVLSFLVQLNSSDLLIKEKKLNTLSIIDCCINLSELFEKMVKLNPSFLTVTNSNNNSLIDTDERGLGIVTANFSGNSFWSPVTDKLWIVLGKKVNLIFRKCTFADESLASLFQALSHHKGKSLHLDLSGIAVTENGWHIFRRDILCDKSLYLSSRPELKPLCLNTLTQLVWDNNVINSSNVKSFVNFLKEQPHLRELSINNCIDSRSMISRKSSLTVTSHVPNDDLTTPLLDKNGNSNNNKKSLSQLFVPKTSDDGLAENQLNLEKEIDFIILAFVDFAKSSKLASFRIRSNLQSTCIGPQLFPLLEQLLKSSKLRVLDIFGQNIGDINLLKVANLIPSSLEEFVFDGNTGSAETLVRVLEQIISSSMSFHQNASSNIDDVETQIEKNGLNLRKMEFPDFDVKNCLSKLSSYEKVEFQTKIEILKRECCKLFGQSDYIDYSYDKNLKNNENTNSKKKNILVNDDLNNVEIDHTLSMIRQYQAFGMNSDDSDSIDNIGNNDDDIFLNDDNDSLKDNLKDIKTMKRKKISSVAIALGNTKEKSFLSDNDENSQSFSFSLNNEEVDSILDECGLYGQKNDPMRAIMEKFSYEFSLDALNQKIEANSS